MEGSGLGVYIYILVHSTSNVTNFDYMVVFDIATPISKLIVPIGLLVYLHSFKKASLKRALKEWKHCCTTKKFKLESLKKALKAMMHRGIKKISKYNKTKRNGRCSHVQTLPSSTYFDIEYTGAFTSITEQCTPTRNYGSFREIEVARPKSKDQGDKCSSYGSDDKESSQKNIDHNAVKYSESEYPEQEIDITSDEIQDFLVSRTVIHAVMSKSKAIKRRILN